jgi:hypothetical protein
VWSDDERSRLGVLLESLVPGSAELGAVAYVEQLLTALDCDPPRLWAGGDGWIPVGPWERAAWSERLAGWRAAYDRLLGGDATDADRRLAYEHACEASYGDPVYGGNRGGAGWARIEFPRPQYPPFFGASAGTVPVQPPKNEQQR